MAAKQKHKELYLKLPYHILNLRGLGLSEKVLLAHIYSFGEKGCWQSNATLADIFMVSPRTISIWISNLAKAGLINKKSPKGYYRTLWAKSHPKVKETTKLWYRNQQISNPDGATTTDRAKSYIDQRKNMHGQCAKSGIRLCKNLRTTNKKTNKETIEKTIAATSPLPAGGQAKSPLTERKKSATANIEEFKKRFGTSKKVCQPLSEMEFENRRQRQLKALHSV